jgi:hypothetical protein
LEENKIFGPDVPVAVIGESGSALTCRRENMDLLEPGVNFMKQSMKEEALEEGILGVGGMGGGVNDRGNSGTPVGDDSSILSKNSSISIEPT